MNRKSFNKRLLLAVLLSAVAVPLLCTAVIGPIRTVISTDITNPEIIGEILGYLINILGVASVFAASACIACAITRSCNVLSTILICTGSVPVLYAAAAAVDLLFYGGNAVNAAYIGYSLLSCFFELVRYGAVILVCAVLKRSSDRRKRESSLELFSVRGDLSRALVFCAATVFLALIAANLTETLTLFAEYGTPVNTTEAVYIILPYPTSLVYSLLGYLLMYVTASAVTKSKTKEGI